jgi:tryptophan-rich sensory protein
MNVKLKNVFWLIFSLAIPLLVGYVGSLLTTPSISTWYATLNKPSFNPPNWLFAPVWTILFILMGIALFLIIKEGQKEKKNKKYFLQAYLSFGFQLFLNVYWSFLFFYIQAPSLAFWSIISLISMIIVNIYYFYQIKKAAAYLLIPYIVWVSFATFLNYLIWWLN